MSTKEHIDTTRIPRHIAIIMDGNGRWARKQGLARAFGHKRGTESVHEIAEACAELGVGYLTLYAFSTENWNRPQEEVNALMNLLVETIRKETPTLIKNNIRLTAIGDISRLPEETRQRFTECIEQTAGNTGLTMVLALSYSARWEITEAVRKALIAGKKAEDVNEEYVSSLLATAAYPDPDLLIRTGGELRISNFLLWQLAYAELYFTDTYWPEFGKEELYKAIADYQKRERRFGKTSEQLTTH